jgi:hypothetical protein
MRQPLSVKIDRELNVGYVKYTNDGKAAKTVDVWEDGWGVMVDFNAAGEVMGIELLSLSDEAVQRAAEFACRQGLEFPRNAALSPP